MNAKRVQAAEGVILAALKTRQTAAGVAIALESACLLQSPETSAETAKLQADLEEMTRCRDNALRALYRDDVETDVDLEETIAAPFYGPGWDWGEADLMRVVREAVAAIRPAFAKLTEERDGLRAERHSTNEALSDAAEQLRVQRDRIAELEAERVELIRQRDQIAMDTMRAIALPIVDNCPICGEGLDDENISDFCSDRCSDEYAELAKGHPSEGALAEQRHLVDPLDHALEALAPRSTQDGPHQFEPEHLGESGAKRRLPRCTQCSNPANDPAHDADNRPEVRHLRALLNARRPAESALPHPTDAGSAL